MEGRISAESATKKQRVSFGEVEYSQIPVDTRCSVKVNDIVDLVFVQTDTTKSAKYRPDFTHQLFENESVELYSDNTCDLRITVEVNCSNLNHKVSFSSSFAELDTITLTEGIQKAIPDGDYTDESEISLVNSTPLNDLPPGTLIREFSVGQIDFEIYLATAKDKGACELLHRAEKLALWFIETADSVDFSDDRWEALFLYAKGDSPEMVNDYVPRYFAGYMTLFSFRNPFRGTKLRVCQALVLPHRQGLGLGREMLLSVYKHIVQVRSDICELTVEDPALGFQRLRDAVDLECLVACRPDLFAVASIVPDAATPADAASVNSAVASTLSEQDVCTALKIIKAQAQFLLEFVEYVRLMRALLSRAASDAPSATPAQGTVYSGSSKRRLSDEVNDLKCLSKILESNDDFKSFRLKVKRRILKNDKELASIAPKSEMQKALSEEFNEELKRFHALENAAKRLGLVRDRLSCLY